MPVRLVSGISSDFPGLSQSRGQVTHVLLTRSPLITGASTGSPFDLHVLSTPPAFVLSQDQTLRRCLLASVLTHGITDLRSGPEGPVLIWPRSNVQLTLNICLNHVTAPNHTPPDGRTQPDLRRQMASTFGTLLSSQRTDAHPTSSFPKLSGGNHSILPPLSRSSVPASRPVLTPAAKRFRHATGDARSV
jgi:hypothetical protein